MNIFCFHVKDLYMEVKGLMHVGSSSPTQGEIFAPHIIEHSHLSGRAKESGQQDC